MGTNSITESAAFAIVSTDRQISSLIESPSIWNESRQKTNTKKRPKHKGVFNTQITYTETTFTEKDRFLTNYPELNIAAVRLEKLESQIDSKTLLTTFKLLSKLFEISRKNDLWWNLPLINVGFDSEVLLEWWHKDRKLDFDILGSSIDYMKVWGADIDDEMEDGSININVSDLISLWKWISS